MLNKRYNLNARILSNTARHFADRLKNEKRLTIAQALKEWNHIVKRSNNHGVSDVDSLALTTGYTRKISLIADLSRIADHFFEMAQCRDTVYDVEQAHAEALQMNMPIDAQTRISLHPETVVSADEAHAEALAINEAYSAQIAFDCHMPSYKATMISWAHQEALDLNRAMEFAAVNAWRARNFDPTPAVQQYMEWLTKARQRGAKLVAWNCPCCTTEMHSLYPAKCGEVWDSATVCPMCGYLYFKITGCHKDGTGHVQLKAL